MGGDRKKLLVEDEYSESQNKSKTQGAGQPIKGFDNEFFRKDLLNFVRARSPSPMTSQLKILPDDMSDEDETPMVNKLKFKVKK